MQPRIPNWQMPPMPDIKITAPSEDFLDSFAEWRLSILAEIEQRKESGQDWRYEIYIYPCVGERVTVHRIRQFDDHMLVVIGDDTTGHQRSIIVDARMVQLDVMFWNANAAVEELASSDPIGFPMPGRDKEDLKGLIVDVWVEDDIEEPASEATDSAAPR